MSAVFSPCRIWRYTLTREFVPSDPLPQIPGYDVVETYNSLRPSVLFVCLNPSTADEEHNDPTVRRCIGFARRWGFAKLVVCNIFALRSTDPKRLREGDRWHAIGPENDQHIARAATEVDQVVVAWGNHGSLYSRGNQVWGILRAVHDDEIHALGETTQGQPKHPLYLRADQAPMSWPPRF